MTDAARASMDSPRSGFIDALRGFALIGICVVNLPFIGAPIVNARGDAPLLDGAVQAIASLLFEGKFFLIFSFLFGLGFSIQLKSIAAGRATPASFARRMTGLFVFGLIHAVVLFPGDILMGYAILGAALWLVRRWPDRRLLWLAGCMAVFAAVVLAVLAAALAATEPGPADASVEALRAGAFAAYRDGGFGDALQFRIGELVFVAPFIVLFNWPLAFAAFCVGLVAGRSDLLSNPDRVIAAIRPWTAFLVSGAIVGNIAFAAAPWLVGPEGVVAFAMLALGGPCLSALYVLALALGARTRAGRAALGFLAPAGRMSLTNYLGQSLVANLIFMGWGGGLYGALGPAALFAVALAIALALIAGSSLWLRVFRSGPDEWLLRSWTALRWQPFLRRRA